MYVTGFEVELLGMTISIDPATHVITILKSQLTGTFPNHELNVNTFRNALKDWEDNEEGIWQPKTHTHNTQVTLGSLTLARVVEILAPYTITFENDYYSVNLVGANNNIADRLNLNYVSVRTNNSAGLTELNLSASVWDELIAGHLTDGTTGKALSDAGSAGNPWSTYITGNTTAGTFGELVGKKLLTIAKFLGLK